MKTKHPKTRLDQLLIQKGFAKDVPTAQALILAGKVLVNESPINKPGSLVSSEAMLRVKTALKYVSRGGLKLEKALTEFKINVKDKICLDIGASTGGFTDCLLQHHAQKVFALDVGYGQMHWRLQTDPRVVRLDRTNFRTFDFKTILEPVEVVVMDVSFTSVKPLLPRVAELFSLHPHITGTLLVLIKPQFEVEKEFLEKGGLVKNAEVKSRIVNEVVELAGSIGFWSIQITDSPITGADGNTEFLLAAGFDS